ncbi:MAG: DUF1722 domain-containing protein, partial [Planctomycetes bacterium]|nr:DUF1722 domain-containing protein [Planctomycetota bacterium]
GQYTVLNSQDEGVSARAVEDIVYHSQFLDALGVGTDAKIILHIGGVYGDKRAAMRRFASRFAALPAAAAGRVVLENDDVSYAIDDVHALAADLGLTVVMDVFHHALVPPAAGSTGAWLERSAATWRERDGRPKIHYSEQLPGGKPGMHSQTVDAATFAAFYREYAGFTADVMLEVKDKNLSAIKCLTCLRPGPTRPALTAEWARYKYTVLRHSQRAYREIRTLLKADQPDPAAMYAIIDAALATPPTPGSETNAAEHVWGYFKTKADGAERRRYAALLAQGMATAAAPMRRFLHRLADKYQEEYLQNSLYFYL